MKHDPKQFGTAADNRAGWYLRAQIERRRQARHAAIIAGAVAVIAAIATGVAMNAGSEGGAAVLGISSAVAGCIAAAANSEA